MKTKMRKKGEVIASGTTACGVEFWPEARLDWVEPDVFAQDTDRARVWVYRAPWASPSAASAWADWIEQQRAVLRCRRRLGKRLVLVNADRLTVDDFATLTQPADAKPRRRPAVVIEPAMANELDWGAEQLALAHLFAALAPEFWTVFEELEAASLLPESATPLTRASLPAGNAVAFTVASTWLAAVEEARVAGQLAADRAESLVVLAEANAALLKQCAAPATTPSELTEARAAQTEAQVALASVQTERDALVLQIAKLKTDELATAALQAAEQGALTQRLADLETQAAAGTTLKAENELLLTQLHQVQEELEKNFLDARAAKAAKEQSAVDLDKLKADLAAAVKARGEQEAAARKHLAETQTQAKTLAQAKIDSDKLKADLAAAVKARGEQEAAARKHLAEIQTQAKTLAQAKIDSDKLKADLAAAIKARGEQEAAARKHLAEIQTQAKTLAQAKIESDKLKTDLAAAVKVRGENENLAKAKAAEASKLQQELLKLRKQATDAEALHAKAAGEIKPLRSENELLLTQLHQVQEELEHYYLSNRELQARLDAPTAIPPSPATATLETPALEAVPVPAAPAAPAATTPATRARKRPSLLAKISGALRPAQDGKEDRKLAQLVALLDGSGLFDRAGYLRNYPDVAEAGMDPVLHYLEHGWNEGRNPGPAFDSAYYLDANPDVRADGANPLVHYIKFGRAEGREGTPFV